MKTWVSKNNWRGLVRFTFSLHFCKSSRNSDSLSKLFWFCRDINFLNWHFPLLLENFWPASTLLGEAVHQRSVSFCRHFQLLQSCQNGVKLTGRSFYHYGPPLQVTFYSWLDCAAMDLTLCVMSFIPHFFSRVYYHLFQIPSSLLFDFVLLSTSFLDCTA